MNKTGVKSAVRLGRLQSLSVCGFDFGTHAKVHFRREPEGLDIQMASQMFDRGRPKVVFGTEWREAARGQNIGFSWLPRLPQ
jgi:hypothetical protein